MEGIRAGTKGTAMAYLDVSRIASWHAHVYQIAFAPTQFSDVVGWLAMFGLRIVDKVVR